MKNLFKRLRKDENEGQWSFMMNVVFMAHQKVAILTLSATKTFFLSGGGFQIKLDNLSHQVM